MTSYGYTPDRDRRARVGLDEAVLCRWKQPAQIAAIVEEALDRAAPLLLTRLDPTALAALPEAMAARLDYDPVSATAVLDPPPITDPAPRVAVVTAGTSDVGVAREAMRTLAFHGRATREIHDVGVAGLWRVLERVEELAAFPVLIVAAGMDAALPSVLGGLVPGAIVAVPTSTGYGVAEGGGTALRSLLSSCAPGITVVNIDNGYGAACAALRVLRALDAAAGAGAGQPITE
jgi:NCAIR mutase (PurE)-related protein